MRSLGETKSDEQLEQMIAEVDVDGKLSSDKLVVLRQLSIDSSHMSIRCFEDCVL